MEHHFPLRGAALLDVDGSVPLDVSDASFAELSELDDDALTGALRRLLRPCGGAPGRTWSNDEFRPEP
jgi:hypothetical protein